eukprot:13346329-Alexandrium_andersonii.AAC.1
MSASLVGSEMCIRDRGRGHVLRRGMPGGPQACLFRLRLAQAQGPQSVSYTHLTLPTICSV